MFFLASVHDRKELCDYFFVVVAIGVGVDLICLNEQPLHAVPLFKV